MIGFTLFDIFIDSFHYGKIYLFKMIFNFTLIESPNHYKKKESLKQLSQVVNRY